MVVARRAVSMPLLAAGGAADLVRGKISGSVQRQRRAAVERRGTLRNLAALQSGERLVETAAQLPVVDPVQPLPHGSIGGRPRHAEQRAQIVRRRRVPAAPRLVIELRKRRKLQEEDSQPGRQAVSESQAARIDRIRNLLELVANELEQPRHRQLPAHDVFHTALPQNFFRSNSRIVEIRKFRAREVCEKYFFVLFLMN